MVIDFSFFSPAVFGLWIFWVTQRNAGQYSQPSIPMGSAFTDSTDLGTKIFLKKYFQKFPKVKTWTCHASNYSHNIYTVLGIISKLEMADYMQILQPFYIRDWTSSDCCILGVGGGVVLEPIPLRYQGIMDIRSESR